ncbi:hypothetical protein NKG94_02575 [Micromonospora sp. M12]
MRITLVIPVPDREMIFVQQPVEALYAATILIEAGHEVSIVDARVQDPVLDRPEFVFVVTQTYDLTQCNSISLNNAASLVATIKADHPGVPTVAVGMHASMEPEMTTRDLGVDASLPGELEVAIPGWSRRTARTPRCCRRRWTPRRATPTRRPCRSPTTP